jgi:hypothetical protein
LLTTVHFKITKRNYCLLNSSYFSVSVAWQQVESCFIVLPWSGPFWAYCCDSGRFNVTVGQRTSIVLQLANWTWSNFLSSSCRLFVVAIVVLHVISSSQTTDSACRDSLLHAPSLHILRRIPFIVSLVDCNGCFAQVHPLNRILHVHHQWFIMCVITSDDSSLVYPFQINYAIKSSVLLKQVNSFGRFKQTDRFQFGCWNSETNQISFRSANPDFVLIKIVIIYCYKALQATHLNYAVKKTQKRFLPFLAPFYAAHVRDSMRFGSPLSSALKLTANLIHSN